MATGPFSLPGFPSSLPASTVSAVSAVSPSPGLPSAVEANLSTHGLYSSIGERNGMASSWLHSGNAQQFAYPRAPAHSPSPLLTSGIHELIEKKQREIQEINQYSIRSLESTLEQKVKREREIHQIQKIFKIQNSPISFPNCALTFVH